MVMGKCSLCGKVAKLHTHHLMPFWNDTIQLCGSCHVKVEAMTKNFLIYGTLDNNFARKRAEKNYKKFWKIKGFHLGKSVILQVRYNLNTEKIILLFGYSYRFKGKGRTKYLGCASF